MKYISIILLILSLLLSTSVYAGDSKPAYLVVATMTSTGQSMFIFSYHEVDNIELCKELVNNSRTYISKGGDAEGAVIIYCAPSPAKAWEYSDMHN